MDVKLPKLGEGADSGVVVNVFIKEGDPVAKGQAIIELENEKAVASIPSTAAGVVAKIHVKPGDKISIGQRLITLNEGGKAAAGPEPAAKRAPEPEVAADNILSKVLPLGQRFYPSDCAFPLRKSTNEDITHHS